MEEIRVNTMPHHVDLARIDLSDLQLLGQRHKDLKNGLSAPPKLTVKSVANMSMSAAPPLHCRMYTTSRRAPA